MAHFNQERYAHMVRSGVIGHAIGDALGVPVEFMSRSELAKNPVRGMNDKRGYRTHQMPAGTWSDDTSMEIALMQSLIDSGRFDYADIMDHFCKWWRKGEYTATGEVFDVGGTCSEAMCNYYYGKIDPVKCGGKENHNNGNGSLMRILPVAFVCYKNNLDSAARYKLAKEVSSLTHAHEISILGCYIYINFVFYLLNGETPYDAYVKMQQDDYSMFRKSTLSIYQHVLEEKIWLRDVDDISASGYVVSSLEAALWSLLTTSSYSEAVLRAVNLGKDTDTVGAITGSMAGIVYGIETFPEDWLKTLKRADYLLELSEKFASTEIA